MSDSIRIFGERVGDDLELPRRRPCVEFDCHLPLVVEELRVTVTQLFLSLPIC